MLPSHLPPVWRHVRPAAGRFLRLSLSNMRAKIPFEDLPNTRRLVGLCQVSWRCSAEGRGVQPPLPRRCRPLTLAGGRCAAQDIYIARAEGELALEEQLYWSLVSALEGWLWIFSEAGGGFWCWTGASLPHALHGTPAAAQVNIYRLPSVLFELTKKPQ